MSLWKLQELWYWKADCAWVSHSFAKPVVILAQMGMNAAKQLLHQVPCLFLLIWKPQLFQCLGKTLSPDKSSYWLRVPSAVWTQFLYYTQLKEKKKKVWSHVKPPWLSKQAPISFLHNCDLLLNNKCTLCKIGFEFSQLMLICKSTATSLTIKITSFMAEIRPSGFQVRNEESSSPAFRAKLRNGTCIQSTYWALPETIGSLKLYLQEEESNPFFWTRYYKDPFLLEPHSDSPLAVGTSTCCPVTLSAPTRTRNTLCPWGTGQPLSPIQHEAGPILGLISHDFSAVRAQRKTVNRSIFLNWGLTWSGKKKNKSSWTKRKGNKQLCCLILKAFSCAAGEWWSTTSSESC